MVWQLHNIPKILLLLTVLHQVLFCFVCSHYLCISKTVSFGQILHIRNSIHHISLYITHIFNTLFGLYTIWKELKQLQPEDQHFQQPRTRKALIQIPPPLDEFLTKMREQLIVFSSTEQASPIQDIQQECSDSQVFETE